MVDDNNGSLELQLLRVFIIMGAVAAAVTEADAAKQRKVTTIGSRKQQIPRRDPSKAAKKLCEELFELLVVERKFGNKQET